MLHTWYRVVRLEGGRGGPLFMSSRGRSKLTTRVKGHRSFGKPALMANSYSNVKMVSLVQEGPVQRSSTAIEQVHASRTAGKLLSTQKPQMLNTPISRYHSTTSDQIRGYHSGPQLDLVHSCSPKAGAGLWCCGRQRLPDACSG